MMLSRVLRVILRARPKSGVPSEEVWTRHIAASVFAGNVSGSPGAAVGWPQLE